LDISLHKTTFDELKSQVTRIQAALSIFRESGCKECDCAASRKIAQDVLSHLESGTPIETTKVEPTPIIEAVESPLESIIVSKLLKERDDLEIELLERYCELRELNQQFSFELEKRDTEIERLMKSKKR
jgi:hypothetical protein